MKISETVVDMRAACGENKEKHEKKNIKKENK